MGLPRSAASEKAVAEEQENILWTCAKPAFIVLCRVEQAKWQTADFQRARLFRFSSNMDNE